MTPKKKAKELVNKMLKNMPHPDVTNANVYSISIGCALIAVGEILKVASFYNDSQPEVIYWQEVKQEIEKL